VKYTRKQQICGSCASIRDEEPLVTEMSRAIEGHLAVVKVLLNSRKVKFDAEESALEVAAFENHLEIFQLLFPFDSDQNQRKASIIAAEQSAFGICAFCLSKSLTGRSLSPFFIAFQNYIE
jgi:hypothetical protein